MTIKILLVDDNAFYRTGLKMMLSRFNSSAEIFEAKSGIEFLDKIKTISPDIVFMDIKMPDMDGINATQLGLKQNSKLNIIALTMFSDIKYLKQMIRNGAMGYLLKDASIDEIQLAIKNVMEGKFYFSSHITKTLKNG